MEEIFDQIDSDDLVGSVDIVVLVTLLLRGMVCPLVFVLHRIGVVVHWWVVWVNLLHFMVHHWFWCMVCHWFRCMICYWFRCMVCHWFRCMIHHWFWFHWLWSMIDWFCMD